MVVFYHYFNLVLKMVLTIYYYHRYAKYLFREIPTYEGFENFKNVHLSKLQVVEETVKFKLYSGQPSKECGHSVCSASYFSK